MGLLDTREPGLPNAAKPYPTEYVYVIVSRTSSNLLNYEMFRSRKAAKLHLQATAPKVMERDYAVRRARLTILHR